MVQIKPPRSVKGEGGDAGEAAPLTSPSEETIARRKNHLQCVVTGLSLLFGLWLTTTIVVILVIAPRCRQSVAEPLVLTPNLYTTLAVDTQRAMAYGTWISGLSREIKCGIDCLFYALDPRDEEDRGTRLIPAPESPQPLPHIPEEKQCFDVPLSGRFDCLPGDDITQGKCEARGCCWKPLKEVPQRSEPFPGQRLHQPTHAVPQGDPPLNVPYCYYPLDYAGYSFQNMTPSDLGMTGYLHRTTPSGYPGDVHKLRMDVFFETSHRIRIKIIDPTRVRWETPLPLVPKVNTSASKPAYSFETHATDGTFTVSRVSSGLPLFSTAGAAPLVYAEQFLQLSTVLPSHYIYGLGEHQDGLLLDTYWTRRVLWNLDQIPESGKNLYGSHPFYLSMEPSGEAHGVFLLNSNAIDVVLQPLPALTFRVIGGVLDLYIFLGPSPNDVISQYTEVVGRPFLPPYWSLGYHQCRFGYGSANATREVWQRTREAGIPFDTQWNDIDYMDHNKDFTHDDKNFKELPQFVQEIHKVGMHYIPIVDPGISAAEAPGTYPPWDEGRHLGVFVKNESNMPFIGKVWNPIATAWPDFTHPLAAYYWSRQLLKYHDDVTFDGVWIDMNEPSNFWSGGSNGCRHTNLEHPPFLPAVYGGLLYYHTLCMASRHHIGLHYNIHNLYGLTETIATNAALQVIRGKRPFVISRSTFPGQGHYGGHWTGDVWSDWYNLWHSIAGVLNFNMFGIPMVGADICGFNGNTTANLCMRWMQLGAFYPFSRNHNTDDGVDQDPVALGERVVESARNALTQRYTLLPYLYTLFFNAHTTGEPVARPLFFQFPKDSHTYPIDTQFLWGPALMVVPVLREHETSVKAYLPEGVWYDWYDGGVVEGDEYVSLSAPYTHIPLLVLGGHILPTQDPGNTTEQSRQLNRGLLVAPDKDGLASGELIWDDGDSLDVVRRNAFTRVQFDSEPGVLSVKSSTTGYKAPITLNHVTILGAGKKATEVQIAGKTVPFTYDADKKVLRVSNLNQSLLEDFAVTWKF